MLCFEFDDLFLQAAAGLVVHSVHGCFALCFVGSTRIGASGCEEFSWIGAMPLPIVRLLSSSVEMDESQKAKDREWTNAINSQSDSCIWCVWKVRTKQQMSGDSRLCNIIEYYKCIKK
jgi:hypothetical protein